MLNKYITKESFYKVCSVCQQPYQYESLNPDSTLLEGLTPDCLMFHVLSWRRKIDGHEECRVYEKRMVEESRGSEARAKQLAHLADIERETGVPKAMLDRMTFSNLQVNEGNQRAAKMLRNWDPIAKIGLLLLGKPGIGKTHLMVAFINQCLEKQDSI